MKTSFVKKSTQTHFYQHGFKPIQLKKVNPNCEVDKKGSIVKEKKGFFWCDFGNNHVVRVRKF